jgi:hypothetical protein
MSNLAQTRVREKRHYCQRNIVVPARKRRGPDMSTPSKHRILVVDDEPSILESMAMLLNEAGYDVNTAEHGFDALLQLKMRTSSDARRNRRSALLLQSQDVNEYAVRPGYRFSSRGRISSVALGVLSHYASDIVGHPAVNEHNAPYR